MLRGNQHGGREYDDLQNWLDMTSHENPLYEERPVYFTRWCHFQLVNAQTVIKLYSLKDSYSKMLENNVANGGQPDIPKGHNSEWCLSRKVIISKFLYSEGSLFWITTLRDKNLRYNDPLG